MINITTVLDKDKNTFAQRPRLGAPYNWQFAGASHRAPPYPTTTNGAQ